MKERRLPTMGDVARLAEVSPATVARVLYAPEKVSTDKRDKVMAAVEATGYRTNVVARGLRQRRSWTIGLVTIDATFNPFFINLGQAIRLKALALGYSVISFQHGTQSEPISSAVAQMIELRADAVIFAYALQPEDLSPLLRAHIPVVQVEQEVMLGTDTILTDSQPGIDQAIRHLAELGHKRIAFMGGDPALYNRPRVVGPTMEEARLIAYRESIVKYGAESDPSLEVLGRYFAIAGGDPAREGREMMKRVLAMPNRPTAILASSDMLAAGILQTLAQNQISVPRDMSLIGFDDSVAPLLSPPISSIGRPLSEMARRAIEMAIHSIESPDEHRISREVVTTSLRCRSSTAPPASCPTDVTSP